MEMATNVVVRDRRFARTLITEFVLGCASVPLEPTVPIYGRVKAVSIGESTRLQPNMEGRKGQCVMKRTQNHVFVLRQTEGWAGQGWILVRNSFLFGILSFGICMARRG